MGWKFHMTPGGNVLCESSGQIWNPFTNPSDALKLLEKLLKDMPCGFSMHGQGDGFGIVAKRDVYAPTLPDAIVAFACKVWGIEE